MENQKTLFTKNQAKSALEMAMATVKQNEVEGKFDPDTLHKIDAILTEIGFHFLHELDEVALEQKLPLDKKN